MTFDEWFQSKQGEPYDSMYVFARDAWTSAIAAEREACAKVAEAAAATMGDLGRQHRDEGSEDSMDRCYARSLQCTQVAADIRARSNAGGKAPQPPETMR